MTNFSLKHLPSCYKYQMLLSIIVLYSFFAENLVHVCFVVISVGFLFVFQLKVMLLESGSPGRETRISQLNLISQWMLKMDLKRQQSSCWFREWFVQIQPTVFRYQTSTLQHMVSEKKNMINDLDMCYLVVNILMK